MSDIALISAPPADAPSALDLPDVLPAASLAAPSPASITEPIPEPTIKGTLAVKPALEPQSASKILALGKEAAKTPSPAAEGLLAQGKGAAVAEEAPYKAFEKQYPELIGIDPAEYDLIKERALSANPENPEDELYKWGTAYAFSKIIPGAKPEDLYNQIGDLSKWYVGKDQTPKTNYQAVADSWRLGLAMEKYNNLADDLGTLEVQREDAIEASNQPAYQDLSAQIDKIKKDMQDNYAFSEQLQDAYPRPLAIDLLKTAAVSGPFTLKAIIAGTAAGAVTSGLGAGPTITGLAAKIASAAATYKEIAGSSYMELRKSGVNPRLARNLSSLLDAPIQSAIESSLGESAGYMGRFLGAGGLSAKIAKRLVMNGTMGAIGTAAVSYAGGVAEEGFENSLQSLSTDGMKVIASVLQEEGVDVPTASVAASKAWEEFVAGVKGAIVLGAPGLVADMRRTTKESSVIKETKTILASEEAPTLDTTVTPEAANVFAKRAAEPLPAGTVIQRAEEIEGKQYILKAGNKDTGDRLGSLRYELDPEAQTVNVLGLEKGRDPNVNAALLRGLGARFPGWDIQFDAQTPNAAALKQFVIDQNPRGPEAGLQHFEAPAAAPDRISMDYIRQRIQEVAPTWTPEAVDVAANVLPMWSRRMGMTAEELANSALDPRIFGQIINKSTAAAQAATGAFDPFSKLIDLSAKANPSTAMHEMTHAVVNFARQAAESSPQVSQFLQELETAMGVKDGNWEAQFDGWTGEYKGKNRSYLEAITYGLEDYFATGKAPKPELEGLFRKLAQWVLDVYEGLKGARVKLSPEMTAYFDDLVGGEGSPFLAERASVNEAGLAAEERGLAQGAPQPGQEIRASGTGLDAGAPADASTAQFQRQRRREIAGARRDLATAQDRAAAGEDAAAIRADTGWSQVNGEWRQDKGFKTRPEYETDQGERARQDGVPAQETPLGPATFEKKAYPPQEAPASDVSDPPEVLLQGEWGDPLKTEEGTSQKAVDALLEEGAGHVEHAIYRDEIGWIDIPWGVAGDLDKDYVGGWGLAHIKAKHEYQDQIIGKIGEILEKGRVEADPTPGRIRINWGRYRAVVRYKRETGEARPWLVTAYIPESLRQIAPAIGGNATDRAVTDSTPNPPKGSHPLGSPSRTPDGGKRKVILRRKPQPGKTLDRNNIKPDETLYQGDRNVENVAFTFPKELLGYSDIHSQAQLGSALTSFGLGVVSPAGEVRLGDVGSSHVSISQGVTDAKRFYFGYSREKKAVYVVAKNGMDEDFLKRPYILQRILSQVFDKYRLGTGGKRIQFQDVLFQGDIDTPEFKTWFGDSKVVDEQGKPLVVYHGSPDARRLLSDEGKFSSLRERIGMGEGPAYFFTENKGVASTYADDHRAFDYQNADPATIPVYLSLKNPLEIDAKGAKWGGPRGQKSIIDQARSGGHDGIIIRNTIDTYHVTGKTKSDVYVAFKPEQIKRPENRGTWDPNDPRILFQGEKLAYPLAGDTVSGLTVLDHIPNTRSISSTFNYGEYRVLQGIREVPLSEFSHGGYKNVQDNRRVDELAEEIKASEEIKPLIVVLDSEPGPYILEGGHRLDALHKLGIKTLPALVVIDESTTHQGEALAASQTLLMQGGGEDEAGYSNLKEIAKSFPSWEEFASYMDTMNDEDAPQDMPPAEKQAWYRALWDESRQIKPVDLENWLSGLEGNAHAGLYDFLEGIWNEILLPGAAGQMRTADEGEATDHARETKGKLAETIVAAAQRIGSGNRTLDPKFVASLMGTIRNNPEEYARIYGEVMNQPDVAALGAQAEEAKYADIKDPLLRVNRMSTSQRAALSAEIQDEELAADVRAGRVIMDEKTKEYIKKLEADDKAGKKKIAELEKDLKVDEANLSEQDRLLAASRGESARTAQEIDRTKKRLERFLEKGQKVPQGYEAKLRSQEERAKNLRLQLARIGDFQELDAQKRQLEERLSRGEQSTPELLGLQSSTAEQLRKLEARHAQAGAKWRDNAGLQTYLAKTEALAKEKEQQQTRAAEKKALAKVKKYQESLVKSIMRKPADNIYVQQATTIQKIQGLIDPTHHRESTQADIDLLRSELEKNPDLAREVPKAWLKRAEGKNLDEMTLQELEDTAREVQSLRDLGRVLKSQQHQQRIDWIEGQQSRIVDAIIHAPGYVEPKGYETVRTFAERFKDRVRTVDFAFQNMRRIANRLDGGSDGVNVDLLCHEMNRAYRKEMTGVDRRTMKILSAFDDAGIDARDWYNTTVDVVGAGPGGATTSLRKSDLLALELAFRNEDSRAAALYGNFFSGVEKKSHEKDEDWFMNAGATRFEALRAAINSVLTPADEKVLAVMAEDSKETGNRLAAVVGEVKNQILEIVNDYFPIFRLGVTQDPLDVQIAEDRLDRTSGLKRPPKNGFTKTRVKITPAHQTPIKLDLLSMWLESIQAQEHYIATAEHGQKLDAIYTNQYMQEQIKAVLGAPGVKYVDEYIAEVKNPSELSRRNQWDSSIRYLRGNLGAAYLTFRASSTLKQLLTNGWASLPYAGPRVLTEGMKCLANPMKYLRETEEMSTYLKHRTRDIVYSAIKSAKASTPAAKAILAVNKVGVKGLEMADRFPVAIAWRACFEKALIEFKGDEVKALEKADDQIMRSQPSARGVDLAPIYRDKGEAMRLLLQFTMPLNVVWQNLRYDVPNAVKNHQYGTAIGIMMSYAMVGVILNAIVSRPPPDDETDEEKRKRFLFYALSQSTDAIPLIGSDMTRILRQVVTGEKAPAFPDTPLPGIQGIMDSMGKLSQGDLDSGLKSFADGSGKILGMPTSGIKELGRVMGGDFGALLGRPVEK